MKKIVYPVLALTLLFASCKKDEMEPEPNTGGSAQKTISLNLSGLEDLGTDFVYEGWLIVNGSPVSTGIFTVDGTGALSTTEFNITDDMAQNATDFVLSIEPTVDPDPAPSDVKLLGGAIANNSGNVSVSHAAALADDFSTSMGSYILATPTDGAANNELSGVWFLDPAGAPDPSLNLPALPTGWEYEGWAVINGTPVTTGKFSSVSGSDSDAPFSGAMAGPAYPGEDFLMNAPAGLTFPTDLSGSTVVVSIEPVPDNNAAPFLLKPLVGTTPAPAATGTSYNLGQNLGSLPTGSVSIQ